MDGYRITTLSCQLSYRGVERATYRVRGVGRDAESNPVSGERRECFEAACEASELRWGLLRMWSEDFLVGNPASTQLMQSQQRRAAVPSVGDGGESLTPSLPDPLLSRRKKICW